MDFTKKNHVFFDLDGTVIDTGPGIKNGVRYTLAHFGIPVKEDDDLGRFIGPPITESFSELYGILPDKVNEAISVYREYYSKTGLYECDPYEGVFDLFRDIKESGKHIYIATSKPEKFAGLLLEKFGFDRYVDILCGATFDGSREKKADILNVILDKIGEEGKRSAVLIGDRHYDIDGAKKCGLPSVGVLWGYGSEEEFRNAGADAIVSSVGELKTLLLG